MMKKLITIIILLISFTAKSQTIPMRFDGFDPKGFETRFSQCEYLLCTFKDDSVEFGWWNNNDKQWTKVMCKILSVRDSVYDLREEGDEIKVINVKTQEILLLNKDYGFLLLRLTKNIDYNSLSMLYNSNTDMFDYTLWYESVYRTKFFHRTKPKKKYLKKYYGK